MRCLMRPRTHEPLVIRAGFEEQRRAVRPDRLDLQVGRQAARDLSIGHERRGAHEVSLLAVGQEHQQRPLPVTAAGENARSLQSDRHPERIIGRAGRLGSRVVVRDQPDGLRPRAWQRSNDVDNVRRLPELGPPRVRLLDPHLETEQCQLVDDVLAGALIGRRADCPAANRAGQHADVRSSVLS